MTAHPDNLDTEKLVYRLRIAEARADHMEHRLAKIAELCADRALRSPESVFFQIAYQAELGIHPGPYSETLDHVQKRAQARQETQK